MLPDSSLRLIGARAAALGGVATIFGAIGHVEAGGSDPGPAALTLIWLGASLVSAAFLMRRAGLGRIAALLLIEQVLVHVSLMAFIGMPASPMPGMENMPGMTPPAPSMSIFPSMNMLVAHALAAFIAGLWLWRGECALWSLLTRVAITLRIAWLSPMAAPRLRSSGFARRSTTEGLAERLSREVPRRGPPRLSPL